MNEDFPAAHSMDTAWYAVDRVGNVARFDTGEAGGVPADAVTDNEFSQGMDAMLRDQGVKLYVDDLVGAADGAVFRVGWDTPAREMCDNRIDLNSLQGSGHGVLLWLADAAALQSLAGVALPMRVEGDHVFAWVDSLSEESLRDTVTRMFSFGAGAGSKKLTIGGLRQLLAGGQVRRAWLFDLSFPIERFGLFVYGHGDEFENWVAGPYVRHGVPFRPLKLDDLPAALRSYFSAARFANLRFDHEPVIQPAEHGPTHSWGGDWIGTDGVRHGESFDEEDGLGEEDA